MFWKNLPNETTPRNAENLSRSERYLLATAGSNGDFVLNIDGASGLAVNDIIRVAFPTATNSSSNARLSIDGGISFKNIVFNTTSNIQLIALFIQNQNIDLIYDGTRFKSINADTGWQTPTYAATHSTSTSQCRRVGNIVYWTGQININTGNIALINPALTMPAWATPTGQGLVKIEMGVGITYTKLFYRTNSTIQIAANPSGNTTYIVTTAIYIGS